MTNAQSHQIGELRNQATETITGGAGGVGNFGGTGGANAGTIGFTLGTFVFGLDNSGSILGGVGGGSSGGAGGAGVANSGTIVRLTNSGTVAGGQGGRGVTGGAGGAGVTNAGSIPTLSNSGKITGDSGGTGSEFGAGGLGGAGVSNSGKIGALSNGGTISGGAGGFDGGLGGAPGRSGLGVFNSGSIATLQNSGTISGSIGVLNINTIGTLNNLAGGLIHGAQTGLSNPGAIGTLINNGTIDPSAGAFAILSTGSIGTITNSGQIVGSVEIANQATVTVAGGRGNTFGGWTGGTITIVGGDLTFARGNTALGDNIVAINANGGLGTVFNDASLMVAAPQTITGNFGQSTTGALDFGVGGDTIGQYGALAITGFATLEGGLGLALTNGFELAAGDSFDFMTYAGFYGDFTRVSVDGQACRAARGDVWSCSVGVDLDVDLNSAGLIVTAGPFTELPATAAIPEPSTWAMLALGFLGLGGLTLAGRKRRAEADL